MLTLSFSLSLSPPPSTAPLVCSVLVSPPRVQPCTGIINIPKHHRITTRPPLREPRWNWKVFHRAILVHPADDRRSRRPLTLREMCFSRQLCALLGLPIEMYGIFMQIFRRLPAEAASFHPARSVEVRLQHSAFVLSALLIFVLSYINIYIHTGNLNIEQVLLFELDSC